MQEKIKEILGEKYKLTHGTFYNNTKSLRINILYADKITEEEKEYLHANIFEILPQYIKELRLDFKKSYVDNDILIRECKKHIDDKFAFLSSKVDKQSISVVHDISYSINIVVDSLAYNLAVKNHLATAICEHLKTLYIGEFSVNLIDNNIKSNLDDIKVELMKKNKDIESQFLSQVVRFVEIKNVNALTGDDVKGVHKKVMDEKPQYISGLKNGASGAVACGRILSVELVESKNEKAIINFIVNDKTDDLNCTLVAGAKDAKALVELLEVDTTLLLKGDITLDFKRELLMKVRVINTCEILEDFVPIKNKPRMPRNDYQVIIPKKITVGEQVDLLDGRTEIKADKLLDKRYVVYSVATAGRETSLGHIIKVGGVSIKGGMPSSHFESFIDPCMPINLDVTKTNGIEDPDLRGKPKIEEAIDDIYKFFYGATLVGVNTEWSIKFLQKAGKEVGYFFDNEIIDLSVYAKERGIDGDFLKQADLAKLLEIKITDDQRALGDLVAQAQIFIKLSKMNEC